MVIQLLCIPAWMRARACICVATVSDLTATKGKSDKSGELGKSRREKARGRGLARSLMRAMLAPVTS